MVLACHSLIVRIQQCAKYRRMLSGELACRMRNHPRLQSAPRSRLAALKCRLEVLENFKVCNHQNKTHHEIILHCYGFNLSAPRYGLTELKCRLDILGNSKVCNRQNKTHNEIILHCCGFHLSSSQDTDSRTFPLRSHPLS